MILLTEIVDVFSKAGNSYEDKIKALTVANEVVKIILLLSEEHFKKLNSIKFILANPKHYPNKLKVSLKEIFEKYHLDPTSYEEKKDDIKYVFEIYDKFPKQDELSKIDSEKKGRIERIINRAEFISLGKSLDSNEEYICYLPLIKKHSESMADFSNLLFIQNIEESKAWGTEKLYVFSGKKFFKTKEQLSANVYSLKDASSDEYRYKHLPFLDQFEENGYYGQLRSITHGSGMKNKSYFRGKDYFISEKSIRYYLNTDFTRNDLRNGVERCDITGERFMFSYIDQLSSEREINKFVRLIRPIEIEGKKIAIQGIEFDLKFYLDNYWEIRIPDSKEIQQLITKLFISMLIEKEILSGDVRRLFHTINRNGFQQGLSDIKYLSDLDSIIARITFISVDMLLNSHGFWIRMSEEIDKINMEHKINQYNKPPMPKDSWEFIFSGKSWLVIKDTGIVISDGKNYITYLVMIIRYHETHNWESIHGAVLQRSVLKFHGEEYKGCLGNAKVSGAWRGQKTYMKKKVKNNDLTNLLKIHIIDDADRVKLTNRNVLDFHVNTEKSLYKKIDELFFADLEDHQEDYE